MSYGCFTFFIAIEHGIESGDAGGWPMKLVYVARVFVLLNCCHECFVL